MSLPVLAFEMEHKRFIHMWRHRLADANAMRFVLQSLEAPGVARQARRWIAEYRNLRDAQEAIELERVLRLRASLCGVSTLLARLCEVEGLSLAAVAYGVQPNTLIPGATEGFPWSDPGGPEEALRSKLPAASRKDANTERRFHTNGTFVRPRFHPHHRWTVQQVSGVLHTHFRIGDCVVRSFPKGIAALDVPMILPETVRGGVGGRPLHAIIEHPVLEHATFKVRSARPIRTGTRISFSSPTIPITLGALKPDPGMEHQQLGRDGSLTGTAAVHDVIRRGSYPALLRLDPQQLEVAMAAGVLEGVERERMRLINLMSPPWGETLALPG